MIRITRSVRLISHTKFRVTRVAIRVTRVIKVTRVVRVITGY